MKLFDLSGRTALVTGGTQGLGRAIAQTLAEHGAGVVVTDLDPAACARTVEDIRGSGHEAHGLSADLSRAEDLQRMVAAATAWRGHIDVLVSNAGVQGPAGPLDRVTDEDWLRVMETNLHAALRLSTLVIPQMARNTGGSVVLMSSIAGLRGNRSIGLYGMSKAALAQLARNLAVEWGPYGVTVNAVSPGLIRSPLSARLLSDAAFMSRRLQATPLRRFGEPEEIAGVVAMLASKAGAFITGRNLVVDGGTTISDGS